MFNINKREDSILEKIITYSIYFFIVIFPFLSYKSFIYSGTSSRSVNLVILATLLGIIFIYLLLNKKYKISIPKSPILIAISAYFLFVIISGIFGLNFNNTFWSVSTRMTGIWYFIHLGLFIYFLYNIFLDEKKRDKIILLLISSTTVFSILYLFSSEGLGIIFKNYKADAFTFGNSSFAGMYIFAVFILALFYLFKSKNKKWWMYAAPVLLVLNPNFINTSILKGDFSSGFVGEARATSYVILLSLVFIFIVWCISKISNLKARKNTINTIFIVSVLVLVASSISLLSSDGFLRKFYLSQSTGARPLVWEMSEKVISQKPILGWGADNFERVFEINYDNRLLEDRYGNEAWFDRAHNVLIDQLVDNGFVGLILYIVIYLVIVYSMIRVCLISANKEDKILASLLIIYFPLHFIELQTAFDTSISFPALAIMIALAVSIYSKTFYVNEKENINFDLKMVCRYILGFILTIFFLWSVFYALIPLIRANLANGYIRTIGVSEKRLAKYPVLLSSPVDIHSFLWRTSTDFQIGISNNPKVLLDTNKLKALKEEVLFFEKAYRDYIEKNPEHFRARLNLADIMIYQRLFGIDKLKEAQVVLDDAIKMVPQAPQSYWMKAVAYIYMKQFNLARESANKGLGLNKDAKQSGEVLQYVESSIKTFPEIDLYFFKQI